VGFLPFPEKLEVGLRKPFDNVAVGKEKEEWVSREAHTQMRKAEEK